MKTKPINIVFKQIFKAFVKEITSCESIQRAIEASKTYGDLIEVLEESSVDIANSLNSGLIDPDSYECDECDEKDDEIIKLEEEIEKFGKFEFEFENRVFEILTNKMKLDCFLQNHQKFNSIEFQQLMS